MFSTMSSICLPWANDRRQMSSVTRRLVWPRRTGTRALRCAHVCDGTYTRVRRAGGGESEVGDGREILDRHKDRRCETQSLVATGTVRSRSEHEGEHYPARIPTMPLVNVESRSGTRLPTA